MSLTGSVSSFILGCCRHAPQPCVKLQREGRSHGLCGGERGGNGRSPVLGSPFAVLIFAPAAELFGKAGHQNDEMRMLGVAAP